jgi:hypothetical protein
MGLTKIVSPFLAQRLKKRQEFYLVRSYPGSVSKKRKTGERSVEERLEAFLNSPVALRASQGLSDRILVALHMEQEDFFFRRGSGENTLSRVVNGKADVHFWLREGTLRHLLSLAEMPDTGIATIGVAIFEHIFTKDEERRIKFRVDAGFLGLWAKGYFSVLKAGGPEVASYLARSGFNGLTAIKAVLKKTMSKGAR